MKIRDVIEGMAADLYKEGAASTQWIEFAMDLRDENILEWTDMPFNNPRYFKALAENSNISDANKEKILEFLWKESDGQKIRKVPVNRAYIRPIKKGAKEKEADQVVMENLVISTGLTGFLSGVGVGSFFDKLEEALWKLYLERSNVISYDPWTVRKDINGEQGWQIGRDHSLRRKEVVAQLLLCKQRSALEIGRVVPGGGVKHSLVAGLIEQEALGEGRCMEILTNFSAHKMKDAKAPFLRRVVAACGRRGEKEGWTELLFLAKEYWENEAGDGDGAVGVDILKRCVRSKADRGRRVLAIMALVRVDPTKRLWKEEDILGGMVDIGQEELGDLLKSDEREVRLAGISLCGALARRRRAGRSI